MDNDGQRRLVCFMGEFIARIKGFAADTVSELKKSSWPSKNELTESTLLVIVSVTVLAVFVAVVDQVNIYLLNLFTNS